MTIEVDKVLEEVVPATSWYIVLRPFRGDNRELMAGEVVDTSDWRFARKLAETRYIKPFPNGVPIPEPTIGADGIARRMLDSLTAKPKLTAATSRPTPSRKK